MEKETDEHKKGFKQSLGKFVTAAALVFLVVVAAADIEKFPFAFGFVLGAYVGFVYALLIYNVDVG